MPLGLKVTRQVLASLIYFVVLGLLLRKYAIYVHGTNKWLFVGWSILAFYRLIILFIEEGHPQRDIVTSIDFWIDKFTFAVFMVSMFRLKKLEIYMNPANTSIYKIEGQLARLRFIIIGYTVFYLFYEICSFLTRYPLESFLFS